MTDEFTPGAPAHRTRGEAPDLRVVPDDGPAPGLETPGSLDHGAWRTIGLGLARERRASDLEWRLGDWAAQADGRFATLAEAAAIADESLSNIKKYVATAKAFPSVRRRTGVAFFLHYEVAALPEEEGESLLDQAAAAHWTRGEMREAVREVRQRMHAEQVAQLEAENEGLQAEIATLRESKGKAREETARARARFKAMHRAVTDEIHRASAMTRELITPSAIAGRHGNANPSLAREAGRAFKALSADIRTARADAAHPVERIGGGGKAPVEAAVAVLTDEIEEILHEIIRRLDCAEPDAVMGANIHTAFEERMKAVGLMLKSKINPAIKRLAGEEAEE